MLLKRIMLGGRMTVKHEPARATIPAPPKLPPPRVAPGTGPDPGRAGGAVRPAPHLHRLGRARPAQTVRHRRRPTPACRTTVIGPAACLPVACPGPSPGPGGRRPTAEAGPAGG